MKLNEDFLQNAQRITSFNITIQDFQSLEFKKEIQFLIQKHLFPQFELSDTLTTLSKEDLNDRISKLKAECPIMFNHLHHYNLKGIGPGEVTLFFLLDDAYLGGGNSAGVDLIANGNEYEVKSVKVSKENIAYDFKLGGSVVVDDLMTDLKNLAANCAILFGGNELSKSKITQLKEHVPDDFYEIEYQYSLRGHKYFQDHQTIFVNNGKNSKIGNIESVTKVEKDDIMIERISNSTIKPMIKLHAKKN